eukprot:g14592.t1
MTPAFSTAPSDSFSKNRLPASLLQTATKASTAEGAAHGAAEAPAPQHPLGPGELGICLDGFASPTRLRLWNGVLVSYPRNPALLFVLQQQIHNVQHHVLKVEAKSVPHPLPATVPVPVPVVSATRKNTATETTESLGMKKKIPGPSDSRETLLLLPIEWGPFLLKTAPGDPFAPADPYLPNLRSLHKLRGYLGNVLRTTSTNEAEDADVQLASVLESKFSSKLYENARKAVEDAGQEYVAREREKMKMKDSMDEPRARARGSQKTQLLQVGASSSSSSAALPPSVQYPIRTSEPFGDLDVTGPGSYADGLFRSSCSREYVPRCTSINDPVYHQMVVMLPHSLRSEELAAERAKRRAKQAFLSEALAEAGAGGGDGASGTSSSSKKPEKTKMSSKQDKVCSREAMLQELKTADFGQKNTNLLDQSPASEQSKEETVLFLGLVFSDEICIYHRFAGELPKNCRSYHELWSEGKVFCDQLLPGDVCGYGCAEVGLVKAIE